MAVVGVVLGRMPADALNPWSAELYAERITPACLRHAIDAVLYSDRIGRAVETFDLSTGANTSADVIGAHYRAVR